MTDLDRFRAIKRDFERTGARLSYRLSHDRSLIELGISGAYEIFDLGIFSDFRTLKTLRIEGNMVPKIDLTPIKEMESVTFIEIFENDSLHSLDLSPLAKLPMLSRLTVSRNSIHVLKTSPIADMHSLINLDLREVGGIQNTHINRRWYIYDYWSRNRYYQDCEARGLSRYALDMENCSSTLDLFDLRFLENHPSLKYAVLSYNRGVRKYLLPRKSPLALEYVDLSVNDFREIDLSKFCSPSTHELVAREAGIAKTSFDGFEEFKSMAKINLYHNKIEHLDLSPLHPLYNLHTLDLSRNRLKSIDLSPLAGKLNLTTLRLESNDLTEIDLSPLRGLPRLQTLKLGDNLLKSIDLEPLGTVHELRELRLTRNQLTEIDIEPLKNCRKLQRLQLARNKLRRLSLKPLEGIVTMEEINLDRNDFEELDISAIETMPHIDFLDLRHTTRNTKLDFTPVLTSDASWVQYDEEIKIQIDAEKLKDAEIKNYNLLNDPLIEEAIDFKKNSKKLVEARNNYIASRAIQENMDLDELLILRFIENRPDVAAQLSRRINELKRQEEMKKRRQKRGERET